MKPFLFLLSLIFQINEYTLQGIYNEPVPKVIEYYGYPSQSHSLYTEDNYNLILHRIPHGRKCKKTNSPAVVLQHGIYQSSISWLFLGPEKSLAFLLADDCYDVWLANARGNCYSRKHKYLQRNQSKYWDFSYHEMGVFDVTAIVDYVVNATNQKDVFYIGYSQGTTAGLINAIKQPETKISRYFFLAPVSYSINNLSPSRLLSPIEPYLTYLTQTYGTFPLNAIGQNLQPLKTIKKFLCKIAPYLCGAPFSFCGYDPRDLNKTGLQAHLLQSCAVSIKQLLHYLQRPRSGFSEYDYGFPDNIIKYNTSSPPKYQVGVIKKPVYLYHTQKDLCGALEEVDQLAEELGNNLVKKRLVDNLDFDHLGFVLNMNVKELVYDTLMADMREALNDV